MKMSQTTASLAIAFTALCAAPLFESCKSTQSASEQMSDSAITAKVKSKMIADSDVKAHNIDVNTEEGVVYLLGRVETSAERAEAERIARSCDGVRDVVNHLKVGETVEASANKNKNKIDD